jgi:methyl-accepting chemotaxis protein
VFSGILNGEEKAMETVVLDFSLAKLHHQLWKMKLRLFLDDQEKLSVAEAISHKDCQLGQWIYSTGLKEYCGETEMNRLEKVHADFHSEIKQVVELKSQGKTAEAEIEYQKVVPLSTQVIDLLESLNKKIN